MAVNQESRFAQTNFHRDVHEADKFLDTTVSANPSRTKSFLGSVDVLSLNPSRYEYHHYQLRRHLLSIFCLKSHMSIERHSTVIVADAGGHASCAHCLLRPLRARCNSAKQHDHGSHDYNNMLTLPLAYIGLLTSTRASTATTP